jgi:hypothetical protein
MFGRKTKRISIKFGNDIDVDPGKFEETKWAILD